MSRGDLNEEGWKAIEPLLPSERGRWGRPAQDNRRFVNGMLWILRTGAPWRDLPEKYGNWNSVYRRFLRWRDQGIWTRILELLSASFGDDSLYSIDSTIVRGHAQAAGAKGGLARKPLVVRGAGSPVKFIAALMGEEDLCGSSSHREKLVTPKHTKR
jgi:transposase